MATVGGSGDKLGTKICSALGIDPTKVRSVEIRLRPGYYAEVTIHRIITDDDVDPIVTQLEKYEAVRRPDLEGADNG